MAVVPNNQGTDHAGDNDGGGDSGARKEPPRPLRVVRYGAMGYVGEFSHKPGLTVGCGARVVVQSERGIELGQPVGAPCCGCGGELTVPRAQLQTYIKNSGAEFCRPRAGRILRRATEQDLNEHNHLNAHIREDVDHCAELAHQLKLDMKIVTAEHLLGGERIVFYFGSPTRIDFRQLVKELAQRHRTRIEMRQVGARDEARLVADYEVCGRECCCRNFLKKLRPVNMKMAKLQKSTLDPSKVSGRCGRLRCCLRYEHYGYEELAERLPRVDSRVETEFGPATVVDRQILTQLVLVRTDDTRLMTIPLEEIRAFNLPPPPVAPPPEPTRAAPPAPAAPAPPPTSEGQRRSRRRGRGGRGPAAPTPGATTSAPAPPSAPAAPPTGEPSSAFIAEPTPEATGSEAPAEFAADRDLTQPAEGATDSKPSGRRRHRGRRRRRPHRDSPGPAGDAGPANPPPGDQES